MALVFAQLAVAAHACVMAWAPVAQTDSATALLPAGGDGEAAVKADSRAPVQAPHHGCHDAAAVPPHDAAWAPDAADPGATPAGAQPADPAHEATHAEAVAHLHDNLCQAHCQYGSTTVDTTSSGVHAPQPATLPPLAGLVLPTPVAEPACRLQRYAAALAPPPPPALLFGVLRI